MALSDWIAGALRLLGRIKDWFLGLFDWRRETSAEPEDDGAAPAIESTEPLATYSGLDIEAGARMLHSENPRGSRELHIEQLYTQLHSLRPGQSLYDRITGGSGWGPQGKSAGGGRVRPVSTEQPATEELRELTREVLSGAVSSTLPGARKFFEPATQDKAFAIGERARSKQAKGEALSEQEQRLLGYKRNAQEIRDKWQGEGARFVGSVDGVEFFT